MKILLTADIHGQTNALKLLRQDFDLLLMAGDLTRQGGVAEALEVLEAFRALTPDLYAVAGNMDLPEVDYLLTRLDLNLHGQGKKFENIGIFGCGGSSPTPFHTPFELSEDEIYQTLCRAYEGVSQTEIKIMVCHTPPFDTRCDEIQKRVHAGSVRVRQWIEEFKPHYCVTGHIHEGRSKTKLGDTLIINPGPFEQGHYALLDLETRWAHMF